MKNEDLKIIFFGTPEFSVKILEWMKTKNFIPNLIITTPDKPQGRKLTLTPSAVKIWSKKNNIPFLQPKKLKDEEFLAEIKKTDWDLFIVASYGKIIPQEILNLPKYKTINVHPSLLPRLRGASPMQSAILIENKTGMTIMLMDAEMDHGPILDQKELTIENWPPKINDLENGLAKMGGQMLTEIIPKWIENKIIPREQNHNEATYIQKIEKIDGLVDLEKDNPEKIYRKIMAFQKWPKTYFFTEKNGKNTRVIIKDAVLKNEQLTITRVLPEGKKEMSYEDFLRGIK